jgi:hypothetical protein
MFEKELYNYWLSRIATLWRLKDIAIGHDLLSVIDVRAVMFYHLMRELAANPGIAYGADDFDAIPLDSDDLKAASIVINDYLGSTKLLILNHKIIYTP